LPQHKTSQTDRRQTDRQTTQCTKGATDSTVGQKLLDHIQYVIDIHVGDLTRRFMMHSKTAQVYMASAQKLQ